MDRAIFDAVGFSWDRDAVPSEVPVGTVERANYRFLRALPEFVWDAAVLEGNPFTLPEVQTLLEGITVGGHKLSDERQVTNLARSARELRRMVDTGEFALNKDSSDRLHHLIAEGEALEDGHFRGEGAAGGTVSVHLGIHDRYVAPEPGPGGENLRRIYAGGLVQIEIIENPFERACAYYLFGALQQFYFDGNKRVSRYMMNGHLMSSGIDAISVPAASKLEFNTSMVDFYVSRDGTAMIDFLWRCLDSRSA